MANTSTLTVSALLFSLEGRIPRSTYWLKYVVPYAIIHIILLLLDINAGTYDDRIGLGAMSGLFTLLTLYPSIAVSVKRCHDRNRSGWFLLVGIVPVLNLWVFVELGFLRGTVGSNRYGPDPLAA